jgi:hypothetical protein
MHHSEMVAAPFGESGRSLPRGWRWWSVTARRWRGIASWRWRRWSIPSSRRRWGSLIGPRRCSPFTIGRRRRRGIAPTCRRSRLSGRWWSCGFTLLRFAAEELTRQESELLPLLRFAEFLEVQELLECQLFDQGLLLLCQGQERIGKLRRRLIAQHLVEHLEFQLPDLTIERFDLFAVLLPDAQVLLNLGLVESQLLLQELLNARLFLLGPSASGGGSGAFRSPQPEHEQCGQVQNNEYDNH